MSTIKLRPVPLCAKAATDGWRGDLAESPIRIVDHLSGRASEVGLSRNLSMPSVAQRFLQKRGEAQRETGRSNSGLKNRLARAAKMIGVKPTTAP
jgi:hypothetical protein